MVQGAPAETEVLTVGFLVSDVIDLEMAEEIASAKKERMPVS
jgi:hypothetical protein